jgi:hypothetical protein
MSLLQAQSNAASQSALSSLEPSVSAVLRDLKSLQQNGLTNDLRTTGAATFDRTLADLARRITPDTAVRIAADEGKDERAKFVAIALDQSAHPERYEELRRVYVDIRADSRRVAPGSPNLLGKHLSKDYRLAWEYFLLRPPAGDYPDRFESRIIGAVAAIGDSASLPAIDSAIDATVQPGILLGSRLAIRQRGLLAALTAFPTVQGADSLGRAMEKVKDAQSRVSSSSAHVSVRRAMLFDINAVVLHAIRVQPNRREQWKGTLTDLLSKPMKERPDTSKLLQQVLEELEKTTSK